VGGAAGLSLPLQLRAAELVLNQVVFAHPAALTLTAGLTQKWLSHWPALTFSACHRLVENSSPRQLVRQHDVRPVFHLSVSQRQRLR
jgi:hypothetical protein